MAPELGAMLVGKRFVSLRQSLPAAVLLEWPEIRASLSAGEALQPSQVTLLIDYVDRAAVAAQNRARGIAVARKVRSGRKAEAIARHRGKTPLTAPDFVDQLQKNFATRGATAPCARVIRRWRDTQLSNVQHSALSST
jgi:hypothetical protein